MFLVMHAGESLGKEGKVFGKCVPYLVGCVVYLST